MKKILPILAFAGLALLFLQATRAPLATLPEASEEVKSILKTSCYDCHSDAATNKKARTALNFDTWDELSDNKKVGKLADICSLVEEGKMPPSKYLNSKPEAALDAKQKKLVCDWAAEESKKILAGTP
jgi:hypothetical protein